MNITDEVGFISLAVSVLSAIISVVFSLRAIKDTKIQQRGQLLDLQQSYYAKLQEWGDKAIDILTEAIFLCDHDPTKMPDGDYFKMWIITRQKLSALIDQGRFFIPNENPELHGSNKPPAYRGFRPPVLECLVEAYELLRQLSFEQFEPNKQIHKQLWNVRKNFVSQVQEILNPRSREEELKSLLSDIKN